MSKMISYSCLGNVEITVSQDVCNSHPLESGPSKTSDTEMMMKHIELCLW